MKDDTPTLNAVLQKWKAQDAEWKKISQGKRDAIDNEIKIALVDALYPLAYGPNRSCHSSNLEIAEAVLVAIKEGGLPHIKISY